jgi:hypothetical protein
MPIGASAVANALDPEAKIAALDVQVFNLGRQFTGLETSTQQGFAAITTRLEKLSQDVNAGQKTPWGVLAAIAGVAMTAIISIGGLVYYPIQQAVQENKTSVAELRKDTASSLTALVDATVSQKELTYRTARGVEDRQAINAKVDAIADQQVPRKEYDERWHGADQRFVDVQRQLDALSSAFGASYSLRDALLDMKAKIDRLEAEKTRGP